MTARDADRPHKNALLTKALQRAYEDMKDGDDDGNSQARRPGQVDVR